MTLLEVASLIAQYNEARAKRLKLDEESKKLKVREDSLLDSLNAANIESGNYGPYCVEVKKVKVARVTDWSGFYAYLKQTGNLDMLTKHLTQSAIMARVEAGEYVPAIVTDDKTSYKFTLA